LYDSIEEVKTYPLDTSIFFMKLQQGKWPHGMQEMLQLTQWVRLNSERYYQATLSVEHPEFPAGKLHRPNIKLLSNYFEASLESKSVKTTFLVSIPGKGQG
jgi:hypothetical protein